MLCLAICPILNQPPTMAPMAPMAPQFTITMMPTMVVIIRAGMVQGSSTAAATMVIVVNMLTPTQEGKVQGSLRETGRRLQLLEEDLIPPQLFILDETISLQILLSHK